MTVHKVRRPALVLLVLVALAVYSPAVGQGVTAEQSETRRELIKRYDDLRAASRYDEAIPVAEQLLAIEESMFGKAHSEVATTLVYLSELYYLKADYARVEALIQRALAIREQVYGRDDPKTALLLHHLGSLYEAQADFARAEPLFRRAREILLKAFGPKDLRVAIVNNNLANLHRLKGDYDTAERLFTQALEVEEKSADVEPGNLADTLWGLGIVNMEKGSFFPAEQFLARALAIQEKAFGPDHGEVGTTLNTLGLLYRKSLKFQRAETTFLRAAAILEKSFGPDYPILALTLSNLAVLYQLRGEYKRAEPLYLRALAIQEKTLGPDHPDLATSLGSLSILYEATREYERAVQFGQRAEEVIEHNLSLVLATGSEVQKQLYLNSIADEVNSSVSLHVRSAPRDQQAARLVLTIILRRKGRALDAMTNQITTLRALATPEDQKLLEQLAAAQSGLAKLRLSQVDSKDSQAAAELRLEEDKRLSAEIEDLQARISRRSAEFRVQSQTITFEAVQQAIPAGAALVELFSYKPFDVRDPYLDSPPHYLAYVVKQRGKITFVDLGLVETIDGAAGQFLDGIRNPETRDAKQSARALDELVGRPLRKLLGKVRNVLISPDGRLNLVPFAALVDERGHYLVEDYSFTYLTSGRDLLRLNVARQNKQAPPVILAAPDFNQAVVATGTRAAADPTPAVNSSATSPAISPNTSTTAGTNIIGTTTAPVTTKPAFAETRGQRSGDLSRKNWTELRGAAEEARYLKQLFQNASVFMGQDATEGQLKVVNAPRILHVSTHGFFLPDQEHKSADLAENPLLRSGLVLAGANKLQGGGNEDGILTALEAAGLNLWGTQLVVLSACETGVGDVRNGEGVYGLRRALVLAGTESQLMTLWKVDDTATSEVMIEYYRRLQAGEERSGALRQVQLEFLRRKTRQHPFYWASFILNGDWRSMRGMQGRPGKRAN